MTTIPWPPEQTIRCTPDNVGEFNAALRQHIPGLHELAKALRARGMINGLGGATLGPHQPSRGVVPMLPVRFEQQIAEAQQKRGEK